MIHKTPEVNELVKIDTAQCFKGFDSAVSFETKRKIGVLIFGVLVQNLNLDLFTIINATSNTALWLIDWGRFLSWWPQLIAVSSLLILILRKKDDLVDGILPVLATVGVAIALNFLAGWIYPLVTPGDIGIGFSWMHGASLGQWMGPYPIFLSTLTLACIVWFKSYLFSISIFVLGMANAWGIVFVGNYFPSQILLGMFISVLSTLVIFLFVRGKGNFGIICCQTMRS